MRYSFTSRGLGLAAAMMSVMTGISLPSTAGAQNGGTLTGTVRLACEAILCLSSGVRPGECTPSLNHYFGILIYNKHGLDWPATVDARRAFLSTCPVVSSPGMPELIDAIASGAGRCDAATLNTRLERPAYGFKEEWISGDAGYAVQVREFRAVSDVKPLYCLAYDNNEYTQDLTAKYVGQPFHGGRWVESRDYDKALRDWQAKHGNAPNDGYTYSWEHPNGDGTYQGN